MTSSWTYLKISSANLAEGILTPLYLSSRWFLSLWYCCTVKTSFAAVTPNLLSHFVSTSTRRVDKNTPHKITPTLLQPTRSKHLIEPPPRESLKTRRFRRPAHHTL